MKKTRMICLTAVFFSVVLVSQAFAFSWFKGNRKDLKPVDGELSVALKEINDGKAHYFHVKADDGTTVRFFALKSRDGVFRAAVDACDVCYRSGKGYEQKGDFMVCMNCGQQFASSKINVLKGGCNPAPLTRRIQGDHLVISMEEINRNSWYCQYKKL